MDKIYNKKTLLKEITNYYLTSRGFNGISINSINREQSIKMLQELLKEDKIILNFGDRHPNPNILALEPEPKEEQLGKLIKWFSKEENKINYFCVYPSKTYLKLIVNKKKYHNKPFTLMLALGEPQLSYKSFNLRVLEFYRNDPRYSYYVNDIHGHICAKNNEGISKVDDVYLESFGFAYDKKFNHRYVAVFLCYLAKLNSKHQIRWLLDMYKGKTILHPDYVNTALRGWFPEKESIFIAFCEEIKVINEMTKNIYGKELFLNTYEYHKMPKEFSWLIRPTNKEYENFIHLLDKMISDNINKDFFRGQVELYSNKIENGESIRIEKGSITLLEDWLFRIKFPNPKEKDNMIHDFKKLKRKRSKGPGHYIVEDKWDDNNFKEQRKLMIAVYKAMRTLRLIFANHPKSKSIEIPDWLYNGDINTF